MNEPNKEPEKEPEKELEQDFRSAAQRRQMSFLGEFWMFLRENKKWWLAPIVIGLSLLGLIAVLSATGLAPFIYTLF